MNNPARPLAIAAVSLFLGAFMYFVSGSEGVLLFLFLLSLSGLLVLAVSLMLTRLNDKRDEACFRTGFVLWLSSLLDYRSGGLSLFAAMEKAARPIEMRDLRDSLTRALKRMKLGEVSESPFDSLAKLKHALPGITIPNLNIPSIKAALELHEAAVKEELAELESACSRYATINMFISTVLPSFIIFAFIGSAIISNSAPDMLLFAIVVLVGLPAVYSFGNAKLNGRMLSFSHTDRKRAEKKEVLSYAKRILGELDRAGRITQWMEGRTGITRQLGLMVRKKSLGELASSPGSSGAWASELGELVALRLNFGNDIKRSLGLFCKRLENEIGLENRLKSKIGGMQALTYMGLSFFLPLFGGISSSILSTSMNILSQSAAAMQHSFLLIIGCYIGMVLYITVSFGSPDANALEHLSSMLPAFALSILILLFTAYYASEIL